MCPGLGFKESKIDKRRPFLLSGVLESGGADTDTQLSNKTRPDKHPKRSVRKRIHKHKARVEGSSLSRKA